MPPKSKKAAVDKAAAEEAERIRLEEDVRLQELKAKKERELREQKEREAFEALLNQEKPRLDDEAQEFAVKYDKFEAIIKNLLDTKKEENEWKRFLECSILPDPLNEPELNAFIDLWAEEPVGSNDDPSILLLVEALPSAEKAIFIQFH
ncbi:hypothetical protein HK100_003785 [Physocladia obscura]|uniref:IC97/Casc1 N-terminal domain-containing protein n=1 Tax=Physocladia obscura TaxID=109957 RepID=A0AAD5SV66_9FUNG|nr:hypothetical protein HK100_003785 [Physocladia obscura]